MTPEILNRKGAAAALEVQPPAPLAEALRRALAALCTAFVTPAGVAYGRARGSAELTALSEAAAALPRLDPGGFGKKQERIAFWLNAHNALAIEAVMAAGIPASIDAIPHHEQRYAYDVGGTPYSLADIRHGILRDNRGAGGFPPWQFAPWDGRRRRAIHPMEVRIHFAANPGVRSGPPLAAYRPENVDDQVDAAARAFIAAGGIRIVDAERRAVEIAPLFARYWRDFGPHERAPLIFAAPYFDEEAERKLLRGKLGEVTLTVAADDRRLNGD